MKHNQTQPPKSQQCDRAILFLRIFISAVMLLHIVGKLQDYDNLVLTYPELLGFSRATSLIISILFEGAMAAMIAIGIGTHLASLLMFIISVVSLIGLGAETGIGSDASKLEFLYSGIYLTLTISGGGRYAADIF